jgi:hypothetical protein
MIDEFEIDPNIFRNAIDKKLFQGPENKRPWRVLQKQASSGEMSWEIEIIKPDGSIRQFPLPDGKLATAYTWLEENKVLFE